MTDNVLKNKYYVLGIDLGFSYFGIAEMELKHNPERNTLEAKLSSTYNLHFTQAIKEETTALNDMNNYEGMLRLIDDYLVTLKGKGTILGAFMELPTAGAQSSRACRLLAFASALGGSIKYYRNLPTEYVSPRQIKKHITGSSKASKQEMKSKILSMFAGQWDKFPHKVLKTGELQIKKGKELEDIADACGAVVYGLEKEHDFLRDYILGAYDKKEKVKTLCIEVVRK